MRKGLRTGIAVLVLLLGLTAYGVAQQMPQGPGGMMGPMMRPGMGHERMDPQGMGPGAMGGEQGARMMEMMGQMMGMMQQMMQMAPMSPEQRQAMAAQCQRMMGEPDLTPEAPKGQ